MLFQNLRYGARVLRRNPAFTLMAALSLALGIGANIAIFSIFNGLFLGSLPFPDAQRLTFLSEAEPARNLIDMKIAFSDFEVWRAQNATFDRMALFYSGGWSLSGFGDAVRVNAVWASYDFGPTLGIQPIVGRYFLPRECRGAGVKVALISYGLWQRLFAGSAGALGQTIHLDVEPYTIIGVLPAAAVYPADVDVWFPAGEEYPHQAHWLDGIGRLKTGVTIEQARADLLRVHKSAIPVLPANRTTEPRITPLRERYLGSYRRISKTLLAAVGFVLLIACVNVAGLILARGMARGREAAIRSALGAGRRTLIQQLLAETSLITLLGGAIGVPLGWAALQGILPLMPDSIPAWVTFPLDARFAGFVVILLAACALISGLWPALEFSKADLRGALVETAPKASLSVQRRRGMDILVAGEIALALVLLTAAGLLVRAFLKVVSTDPGFGSRHALTFAVNPPYRDDQQRRRYYRGIFEALQSAPGVESVGQTNMPPLGDASPERTAPGFRADGQPPWTSDREPRALQRIVMPGYFRAMRIQLKAGRDFDEHDLQSGVASVIVNETFARQLWPDGTDVIGRRIAPNGYRGWMTVVGVVSDVRYAGLDNRVEPWYYFCQVHPWSGESPIHMYYVIRGTSGHRSLLALAHRAAQQMDPGLAIYDVHTMQDLLDHSVGIRRAYSWLFVVLAGVALLLTMSGIYSLVFYTVTQRTREIGIRVALGASPRQVVADVMRSTLRLAAAGILIGLCGSWFATTAITSLLAGVSSHDPWSYGIVLVAVCVAVVVATLVPASRASLVDPVSALR